MADGRWTGFGAGLLTPPSDRRSPRRQGDLRSEEMKASRFNKRIVIVAVSAAVLTLLTYGGYLWYRDAEMERTTIRLRGAVGRSQNVPDWAWYLLGREQGIGRFGSVTFV